MSAAAQVQVHIDAAEAMRQLRLVEYQIAHRALDEAKERLVATTKNTFPIGAIVRSQIRHGVYVVGEVVGHEEVWGYPGSILVRNLATGKTHRAYPKQADWVQLLELPS